ncbi:MAG: hypothetical protein FJ255_02855 [Phycisphaerae bacterium]|nr:hypothetical protein [Phycisphaerae bacterium]
MTDAGPIPPAYTMLPRLGSRMWKDRPSRFALLSWTSVPAFLALAPSPACTREEGLVRTVPLI